MQYIIVNSVRDGNRYLRKENKQTKGTTSNVKCVHLVDFAKEVVTKRMAKQGCLKALDVLDSTSGAVLLLEILEENAKDGYFVPRESLSQDTAQEVWNILKQLRMGVTTEAYEKKEHADLIQIKALIESYEKSLEAREQYDIPRLYKTAIEILEAENHPVKEGDCYVISDICEQQLTALEQQFLHLYTKENYEVFALLNTLEEKYKDSIQGAEFFKAYGMANEVRYVVSDILEKKRNLGEIEVFYSTAEYEPFLEAQFGARDIPYAMTNRQLPADNKYIHVMKYILDWAASDYTYEALKPVMILSYDHKDTYFSEIRAGIGWGAERYYNYFKNVRDMQMEEEEETKKRQEKRLGFCDCLETLLAVFECQKGVEISCQEVFWRLVAASRKILGSKKEYKNIAGELKQMATRLKHLGTVETMKEVIATLSMELKELTYNDDETASVVAIRKLDANIHILERKHIYVLGMSNAHFAGSAVESPVLSDEELESYLDIQKGYVSLIKNQEEKKKQALFMTLATRAEGTLTIGYACYDTVNLRSMSPSIPFIRMMQEAGVTETDIAYAGYENIVRSNIIYAEDDVWQKVAVKAEATEDEETDKVNEADVTETELDFDVEEEVFSPIKSWSATSLQQLLACPLQFYYQRVLFLPDENYKMPQADRWLPASEKGTLAHEIMENYCNAIFLNKTATEIPSMIQDELFEDIMQKAVQKILAICPYMSKAAYEIECELIRRNCRNYLEKMHKEFSHPSNKWVVVACEAEFDDVVLQFMYGDDFANLHFSAKMDRLDAYVDEEGVRHYRIVDYKSGSQQKHIEKISLHENIQHIVYKLALEAAKKESEKLVVDQVSFLHFFEEDPQKQEITLSGSEIANFPVDVQEYVVRVLKNANYIRCSIADGKKDDEVGNCKYCTYKDICMAHIGEKL